MTFGTPLVSILTPTFNRKQYLLKAISSALNQTYPNFELLVHDDASTDGTTSAIKQIKDKRLNFIRTTTNHGMIGGWNYILKKAHGEWIKYLADDDLLDPHCVEEEIKAAHKNPKASIVTCKRKFIDQNGKLIKTLQFAHKNTTVNGLNHARWILSTIRENKIGEPSAALFRRDQAVKVGLYDPQFSQFADFEFWIRLLAEGELVYINKALCSFRIHSESNTHAAINDGRFITETFKLIEKYYTDPYYSKRFHLTDSDRQSIIRLKTLDIIKNVKDLFVAGKINQSRTYFRRLSQHVNLPGLTAATISHLLQ